MVTFCEPNAQDLVGSAGGLMDEMNGRLPEFVELRRDLHRHPETAFEEVRTARIVADKLTSFGIEVVTGIGVTGVVGILKAGANSRTIGIRADMDALNMDELNGFDHRSTHPGKMHGCGHDGHTATLLAAACQLAATKNFDGTIYFIFQPAEEAEGGAPRMIEDGLFTRFPMDAVYALHNLPGKPVGQFAVKAGPMMAGVDQFDIRIEGVGGHAAMPHITSDPVVAAGALIQALQTAISRAKDPVKSGVMSITRLHGGASYNVIPDKVELAGTVRYFDPEVQNAIIARMESIVDHVAQAHGCKGVLDYQKLYPATINTVNEAAMCAEVLVGLYGASNVDIDPQPLMAGEDFGFMLQQAPGCYILAGNGDGVGGCSVHNGRYDFNDDLIPFGAAYWVRLAETALPCMVGG